MPVRRAVLPAPRPNRGRVSAAGMCRVAVNLPYADLLDPDTGCVADAATLLARFARAGVDLERPLVTSCGSGVTAAVLSLALALIGHDANALYDGSWAEWGGLPDTAIDQ